MAIPSNQNEEIARRYGLEAIPESVLRLTQMVAHQNDDLDHLASLITMDRKLSARLLRAANPRAESEDDYTCTTVEGALSRCGVGCAMLLAMSEPLSRAVLKAFHTMLAVPLEVRKLSALDPLVGSHLLSEVGFVGKAVGAVTLRLPLPVARRAAVGLLGMTSEEIGEGPELDDAIGELTNIVCGNFKSNLCDAGLDCKLSPPRIGRTEEFKLQSAAGGLAERLGFLAPQTVLFVDIRINPWGS
ncbi:MAG: hypothetical protein FD140_4487 [Limisphaerales bacterium]|nr:MAG: hypothetical protein FD140_4487 [Limisphaerales bacterium]